MDSIRYSTIDFPSKTNDEDFDFVPSPRFNYKLRGNSTIRNWAWPVLIALCIFFAVLASILAGLLHNAGQNCIDKGLSTELGELSPPVSEIRAHSNIK